MFYAVRLCGNPTNERYLRPIEFMVEGEFDGDIVPLERDTEDEIAKVLEDNALYNAGWVSIIEI